MLTPRRYILHRGSIPSSPLFLWDGSHLGTIKDDQIVECNNLKIGRVLKIWKIRSTYCLVKTIESLLPAIIDELKPIFGLPKIGTHTFRHGGKLMLAYQPYFVNGQVYQETTLNDVDPQIASLIEDQVRLNLAFREFLGVTDTHDKSLLLRYINPANKDEIPTVISFLEPGSVAGHEDGYSSILSQVLIDRWFNRETEDTSLEKTISKLLCLNRDSPQSTISYYKPLVEEVIIRIDRSLITYTDLFFDRLSNYLPY